MVFSPAAFPARKEYAQMAMLFFMMGISEGQAII